MQRRIRRAAWAALLTLTGSVALAACGNGRPAPAASTVPGASAPMTASSTPGPSRSRSPRPSISPSASPGGRASDSADAGPGESAGPRRSAGASPTRAPSPAVPGKGRTGRPTASAQAVRKPDVVLTGDPDEAGKELERLKKTGWWNPDEIEYADDPVTALQQFDTWLGKGYVAPGGGWTPAGRAAVEAANNDGPEL